MLQLETVIVDRLRSELPAGWSVKGEATDAGDRRPGPSSRVAVVALIGTAAPEGKTTAVLLRPTWAVTLASRRGPATPAEVDAALIATIRALHNWPVPNTGGLSWVPFELGQVQVPPPMDDGLTGLEITFTTGALYRGQP